ncbi:MAG TPA: YceH family protein [Pyrinomonadaceae bacterium]|nr:YceH family protein [Pyrinomonadaceae bacterium]
MITELNEIEARVLGSLVEKQVTTPEYYPLTLNSLTLACNQKNNRTPVTSYSETEVAAALETLREKNLAYVFYGSTSRVPKYKHVLPEVMHLSAPELALICVLLLRGPQTTGELATRAFRLHEFSGLEEVETTLNSLISREPDALVMRLPRQPGQKEARFAHLLSGEVSQDFVNEGAMPTRGRGRGESQGDRVVALEAEVETLKAEVGMLKTQFEAFKKQFE